MKYLTLLLTLHIISIIELHPQSILTFDGQDFATEEWTENGILWYLGGWANIRDYTAKSEPNHAMVLNNNYLEADHNININSLWIYIDDMYDANSYVDFKGYNSSGSLIMTQRYNSPHFSSDYEQVFLSGFNNITRLVFEFDDSEFGGVSINIDDVDYSDLGPLPVELTTFTAKKIDNTVVLNWRTSTEINNYGFQVQRTKEKQQSEESWEEIGFIEGHGNSNSVKEYSFIDASIPLNTTVIGYRLKQIDFDGLFNYSNEIEIDIIPQNFSLSQNFPNPFNPSTLIQYSISNVMLSLSKHDDATLRTGLPTGRQAQSDILVTLKVYDILGNEVATLVNENQSAGKYNINYDASNLNSGVYFYKLRAGEFIDIKKMLLIK